ncbi:hypothetical protein LDENG_00146960 [Lucifuga dentata]|nr:hypothetical protein LDENG_00146960 [Lucifuga dentata]
MPEVDSQALTSCHPKSSPIFDSGMLPFSSKPQDFSLPNSSWGPEMRRLYEHYNSQCKVETEGGEKRRGPWIRRLPSYNHNLKHPKGVFTGGR